MPSLGVRSPWYEQCSGERDDSITIYKETDQSEPHTLHIQLVQPTLDLCMIFVRFCEFADG